MGDRANFLVKQSNGDYLCIYGHWAGYEMFNQFANAIDRVVKAGRERDEAYANRIIISALVAGEWSGDLGWGVSINYLPDNEHSIPVVDFSAGTVSLYDSPFGKFGGGTFDPSDFDVEPKFTISIDRFIEKYEKVDTKPLTYTRV
jgi:hypothetical protein